MKSSPSPHSREQGSTLLVSLWTMLIIGVALLAYLQIAKNQNQLVFHSQVWNEALPLAEAGLEDALNHSAWNSSNWVSNGWLVSGTNTFYCSNTVGEGWYRAIISTNAIASNFVTITSTGYYPMPGSSTYVPRTIQATALRIPVYKFALYGKSGIDFNGNGCRVDSYDSSDDTKSTSGLYDINKARDKADIATYNGTPGATYDLGNGNIWGHIYMGPNGKVKNGPQGKAGSVNWQKTGPSSGVEPGWLRTDLNITIPDVTVPFVGGLPPGPGALGYDYIFVSGVYQWPTLTGKVLVAGNALIYVTGNIKCNVFTIATNCSVTLYCGGSVSFNDTDNQTQRAQNFQILGLKSCKLLDLDNEFMGSVYAPYASVTFVGQKQIYGSIAADQITLKGGSDLHYDEALFDPNSASQNRGFIVISWVEL